MSHIVDIQIVHIQIGLQLQETKHCNNITFNSKGKTVFSFSYDYISFVDKE